MYTCMKSGQKLLYSGLFLRGVYFTNFKIAAIREINFFAK